jgi:hypothetical protein
MKKLIILGTLCLLFTISAVSQSKKEWERVQTLNSWNVYQQFLLNYPSGKYSDLARQKQALLKKPESVKKVETKKAEAPVEKNTASAPAGLPKKDGQIEIKKHAAFQNDKRLNGDELKNLLLSDPESAMEYNKSKSTATIGFVAVGIGAAFGIYSGIASVSSSLKDIENISNGSKETSDPSSYLIPSLIATGCELIGIALLVNSNNQHKKSISIYNSKHTTGFNSDQKLELGITRDGIGITYHF